MSKAHSNTTLGGSALGDRIATAFADGATYASVLSLIAEAESAALASGKSAEHARERALDPTLTANAVVEPAVSWRIQHSGVNGCKRRCWRPLKILTPKGNDEVSGRIVLWPIRLMTYPYGHHLRAHLTNGSDL